MSTKFKFLQILLPTDKIKNFIRTCSSIPMDQYYCYSHFTNEKRMLKTCYRTCFGNTCNSNHSIIFLIRLFAIMKHRSNRE